MDALEQRLVDLGAHYFPETPDIATRVVARLESRRPRRLRLVLVPALVVAVAAGALSPEARSLAATLFRLEGVTIERQPELGLDQLQPLPLGERVSLAEARRRSNFALLVPTGYDAVYLDYRPSGAAVTFVWGSPFNPHLLLTEFVGETDEDFLYKQAGPDTRIEELRLNGLPAFWISGAPHLVYYSYGEGIDQEELHLAGDVLIWRAGKVTLRLEGTPRHKALALAAELRP